MKIQVYFLLFLSLSLFACKKELQGREIPFQVYVDVTPGLNPWLSHYFPIRGIPALGLQGSGEIRPGSMRIWVEEGELSVDFIRDAFFYMGADSALTEMGFRQSAPTGGYSALDLVTSIAELRNQIGQDTSLDLTLKLNLNYAPQALTRLRIDFSLFVEE